MLDVQAETEYDEEAASAARRGALQRAQMRSAVSATMSAAKWLKQQTQSVDDLDRTRAEESNWRV